MVLKAPGVDQACTAVASSAGRFLKEYLASSVDRSSLGTTCQSLQKLGLVSFGQALQSAKGQEALLKEILARHLRVQEGKLDGGTPKGPWIRNAPGSTSGLVLTAQKFGISPSELPKNWQSVERHPYRTQAARRFIRLCKIS